MIRRPPRSTQSRSSAASDVYKRQTDDVHRPQVAVGVEAGGVHDHFRRVLDAVGGDHAVRADLGDPVSYTHLRAHETVLDLVCRLLLEKKTSWYYETVNIRSTENIHVTSSGYDTTRT